MERRSRCLLVVISVASALALAACGGDNASEEATTTGINEPTTRTDFEVTIDGDGCTVVGPKEVPAGEYSFLLADRTGEGFELFVRRITGGHTYQDLLDAQGTPGVWFDRPDFIEDVLISFNRPVDLELAENESVTAWVLEPGRHDIHTGKFSTPRALWICAPLEVTSG